MKHFSSFLGALLLSAAVASPAFAQGGMGDGPGGGRGPSRGPETPGGGSGDSGEEKKKEEPKVVKPALENAEIALKFFPTDLKSCENVEKTLGKVPLIKKLSVTPGEAKMLFTGNYDQLMIVQNAAIGAKVKAALVSPAIFTVDVAAIRNNPSLAAADALAKIGGVAKTFGEGARVTVFGPVDKVSPKDFDSIIRDFGWKVVAIRSHRLRTLSYEPWEKGIRPEKIKERLLKGPGVLPVDVDAGALTVSMVIMRETAKDLDIVSAAEDVMVTIFPGKAEEEEEAPAEPAPAPAPGAPPAAK